MITTETYQSNKPFINSLITGLFYFLFTVSVYFIEVTKIPYMVLMPYLPGVTFPLLTTYYNLPNDKRTDKKVFIHFVLSVLVNHGCVWLYSGEGSMPHIVVAAGAVGSLLYLLTTKYILRKRLSLTMIWLASTSSGLVFLPYDLQGTKSFFMLGPAILIWTLINGLLLNREYKISPIQVAKA
ncbi:hypothetical protein [Pontibacter rugosus]|uniref:TspO/MBR related protein n=1 Tax=Pontibacter rugosus TaxID=1745966 RepID=A0ABW3SUA9_9BACT